MKITYNSDLAIVIATCDKYMDIVDEYVRYFKKNWPDCPFELILVSETKPYKDDRVTSITTSVETEWTGRVLAGMEATDCNYILTCIEDGFISEIIDTTEFFRILEFIKKHDIKYYRNPKHPKDLKKNPHFKDFPNAYKIKKNEIYGINLGYIIWDRNYLKEVFGDGTMNAWQVEEYWNEIAINSSSGYYDDIVSDRRNFLHIIETVTGGKWMPAEIKRLEALGLPVNLGNRDVLPPSDTYRRKLHEIANAITPIKWRKTVKRVFSALGYRFVTKN